MKILIYGFKQYKNFKINISEEIVEKVKKGKNLIKIIFPVIFDKTIFINKIKEYKPNVVLGLGQHPRCRKIRIERKTINLYKYHRLNKREKPKIIYRNKPKYYYLTWKLQKDQNSLYSYNAGKYVCNFSMYIIADYCRNNNIKFAFLHIPKDYSLEKAVKFVENKLRNTSKNNLM